MRNEIGTLGENIFNLAISRNYKFRSMHLGEKWPISDFYVELIGTKRTMFFVVQIKSTDQGLNSNGNLKINLPKIKLHSLNSYYCPTYLAGVNNLTEKVYLKSINRKSHKGISSLPLIFELNKVNLDLLYDEVIEFWSNSNIEKYKSSFKHKM